MIKNVNKAAIVRQFKDGDSIILFPCEAWGQGYDVASYITQGQHGAADYNHILNITKTHPQAQEILDQYNSYIATLPDDCDKSPYWLASKRTKAMELAFFENRKKY